MAQKNILIFADYYLPGYRAGGPIRSVSNLVDWLGDDFNFYIVTSAFDYGMDTPYPHVKMNEWSDVGKAKVFYMSKRLVLPQKVKKLIRDADPELIMFNSFFSPHYTIAPLLIAKFTGFMKQISVLVAPRGEFSSETLRIKSVKKAFFIRLAKLTGIYSDVNWALTNEKEEKEFYNNIGLNCRSSFRFPNLPQKSSESSLKKISKEPGKLKMIYLGRVARIKNLKFALNILRTIRNVEIEYNIYGVQDDPEYWEGCKKIIEIMPPNIIVRYKGDIKNEQVPEILSGYHLFFLPTESENFGHAIYESLLSGTPVLISDQTPWRKLEEKKMGWDIPLNHRELFTKAIENVAAMKTDEINRFKENVFQNIRREKVETDVEKNREVFNRLTDGSHTRSADPN